MTILDDGVYIATYRKTSVEEVPPGESGAIDQMIKDLKKQLTDRYINKHALVRRDAHPKTDGLVIATFKVSADCPPELRHGIFQPSAEYNAFIRFSNGDPVVSHDLIPDIRGMAIKLKDVKPKLPTDKFLIEHEPDQDFLLATAEAFFGKDAVDFVGFIPASESLRGLFRYFVPRRLYGGWRFVQALKTPPSPLALEYFSQTPYRLGPHCVKYSVRPLTPRKTKDDPWYMRAIFRRLVAFAVRIIPFVRRWFPCDALRQALRRDLDHGPFECEFFVQRWPDLSKLPTWAVENATKSWPWPRMKVATISLFGVMDKKDEDEPPERWTFTPWHALEVHQPMGSINRARLPIYLTMSRFRNSHNP